MVNGHGVHTNKKYTTFHMITTENQLDTSAKRSPIMFSLFYIRLVWSDDYLLLEIIGYSSLLQGAGKILIKKGKKIAGQYSVFLQLILYLEAMTLQSSILHQCDIRVGTVGLPWVEQKKKALPRKAQKTHT